MLLIEGACFSLGICQSVCKSSDAPTWWSEGFKVHAWFSNRFYFQSSFLLSTLAWSCVWFFTLALLYLKYILILWPQAWREEVCKIPFHDSIVWLFYLIHLIIAVEFVFIWLQWVPSALYSVHLSFIYVKDWCGHLGRFCD